MTPYNRIKDELIYLPVLLAFETGLRQSEITGIKWSDIDLENGLLTVRRNYSYNDDTKSLGDKKTKTKSSNRTITLFDSTINALKLEQQNKALNKILLGDAYEDTNYVCTSDNGKAINPHYISKRFATLVNKLSYSKIRFHDLRHSHATLLFQFDIHPKIVSARLGHSGIGITLDTYTHFSPDIERTALTTVNKEMTDFHKEKEPD